ncbi:pyridoxal phosphate-dependent aminotransferase [Streptococcus danieliae]|uniref:Aminotransferase n=1 Tax=Streptococcus danieliae TaxID=747656 RepID=A0A7Z0S554_9STRE|nr:pyridoxal phosphate-dependent aminotransferase [Streptococcus danieliae]MBF0699698.1 pyridoxal phosphate-dependent aminotransferase [Streptococcus danieliae]NYS96874.1 pyridoxal phosphate-dependent aminotransferase [Streptococcus danieliae]
MLADRVKFMEESATLAAAAKAKALAAEGRDILSLTLGEPDFTTPAVISQAAKAAIESGQASFYTASSGLPALKEAVQDYMVDYYGYEVQASQILVTTGAKLALAAFFLAVLNPGDQVLIPTPYWVSYVEQVKLAQGEPVFVEGAEAKNFKINADQLEELWNPRVKVLLLNNPSNPTGNLYTREELEALAAWAIDRNVLVLADDIYGRLVYNKAEFVPISSLSSQIRNQTVVITGVSKTYAMTGWRIGFAVGPQEIIQAMGQLTSQLTSNPTTVAQYAAIAALKNSHKEAEEMRLAFEERLNTIYPLLNQVPGFRTVKPQGAFYLFPNVEEAMKLKGFTEVADFTNDILEQVGLALVAGDAFGSPHHVRMSYATDLDILKEGILRLEKYMNM